MTPPDARQVAEQIAREAVTHDSTCRADHENGCDCGYSGAVGRTMDAIMLALSEARRQVWEELHEAVGLLQAARLGEIPACTCATDPESCEADYYAGAANGLNDVLNLIELRQRALPSEQTETPR